MSYTSDPLEQPETSIEFERSYLEDLTNALARTLYLLLLNTGSLSPGTQNYLSCFKKAQEFLKHQASHTFLHEAIRFSVNDQSPALESSLFSIELKDLFIILFSGTEFEKLYPHIIANSSSVIDVHDLLAKKTIHRTTNKLTQLFILAFKNPLARSYDSYLAIINVLNHTPKYEQSYCESLFLHHHNSNLQSFRGIVLGDQSQNSEMEGVNLLRINFNIQSLLKELEEMRETASYIDLLRYIVLEVLYDNPISYRYRTNILISILENLKVLVPHLTDQIIVLISQLTHIQHAINEMKQMFPDLVSDNVMLQENVAKVEKQNTENLRTEMIRLLSLGHVPNS